MKPPRKLVFVMEGFAPYRVPFWNELGRHYDLTVLLLSPVEKGRQWETDWDSAHCRLVRLQSRQLYVNRIDWALNFSWGSVRRTLDRLAPDLLLVGGWSSPGYWAARSWGLRHHVPMVFWSESHILSARTRGRWVFDEIKRRFLAAFDSHYTFSQLGVEYLTGFGVPRQRITEAYNLPDIDAFDGCERLEADPVPKLLYVGRIVENKGIWQMAQALAELRDRPFRLLVAGDGPLRGEFERRLALAGLSGRVQFLGYLQQRELKAAYRRADILVFPTLNEVWGMVAHEALLSGLYVVGSDRAASTHALIRPGVNGESFSPTRAGALAQALGRALDRMPFDRRAIRASVQHISVAGEVAKLRNALERAAAWAH